MPARFVRRSEAAEGRARIQLRAQVAEGELQQIAARWQLRLEEGKCSLLSPATDPRRGAVRRPS